MAFKILTLLTKIKFQYYGSIDVNFKTLESTDVYVHRKRFFRQSEHIATLKIESVVKNCLTISHFAVAGTHLSAGIGSQVLLEFVNNLQKTNSIISLIRFSLIGYGVKKFTPRQIAEKRKRLLAKIGATSLSEAPMGNGIDIRVSADWHQNAWNK